ncbi:hypothetical protein [Calycomorphotria hydatis]|uniref:50S ribosomal protein L29 n=1 Tax=Calycomorphotria hydatis TaxID=2528027 RepID=A0A517T6C0_9PLAN|nr:hypothetical protein [Calycomorphotria hydatis]QDT63901.1 hypothetical protein V22_11280 [Calycomorphotria hydatis]
MSATKTPTKAKLNRLIDIKTKLGEKYAKKAVASSSVPQKKHMNSKSVHYFRQADSLKAILTAAE